MKRAGCRMIAFGVESGNAESLALLRKDIKVEETVETLIDEGSWCLFSCLYDFGCSGETLEDVWRSIRFAREIGADYVQFSLLSAMPGTSLSMQFDSSASVTNFWMQMFNVKR